MTQMILRQSLIAALQLDRTLHDWVMTRLNMSTRATIRFYDPHQLGTFGDDACSIFGLADNLGDPVGVHIIPMLSEIGDNDGSAAMDHALAMQDAAVPVAHSSVRVALIAPPALVRRHWHAARAFPYWIDFDAFTKRQIDQRAA